MRSYVQIPEDEVLDRLLELNHTRYADERRRGLQTEPRANAEHG